MCQFVQGYYACCPLCRADFFHGWHIWKLTDLLTDFVEAAKAGKDSLEEKALREWYSVEEWGVYARFEDQDISVLAEVVDQPCDCADTYVWDCCKVDREGKPAKWTRCDVECADELKKRRVKKPKESYPKQRHPERLPYDVIRTEDEIVETGKSDDTWKFLGDYEWRYIQDRDTRRAKKGPLEPKALPTRAQRSALRTRQGTSAPDEDTVTGELGRGNQAGAIFPRAREALRHARGDDRSESTAATQETDLSTATSLTQDTLETDVTRSDTTSSALAYPRRAASISVVSKDTAAGRMSPPRQRPEFPQSAATSTISGDSTTTGSTKQPEESSSSTDRPVKGHYQSRSQIPRHADPYKGPGSKLPKTGVSQAKFKPPRDPQKGRRKTRFAVPGSSSEEEHRKPYYGARETTPKRERRRLANRDARALRQAEAENEARRDAEREAAAAEEAAFWDEIEEERARNVGDPEERAAQYRAAVGARRERSISWANEFEDALSDFDTALSESEAEAEAEAESASGPSHVDTSDLRTTTTITTTAETESGTGLVGQESTVHSSASSSSRGDDSDSGGEAPSQPRESQGPPFYGPSHRRRRHG
ncbi:uncharacterized protein HMPREF1541_08321 [Cyphellophora europaea CBS 101466]|uniref:Uncharacterized protein n=1 Tax=Cyphellophora europaea (strain CBS 101466) TaxID=1220924 RepID=W2RLZ6_CYPE1|nr:uncharacterized protein HMPREF1541_08321 [Cyphellophora europaea CBS 101466]ETN37330.1 hypothetical protein HMPREF1541_08321 [Cyphellophora europaea CBS 101466]